MPERYTGYSGKDAHRVWRSIYEENCFGLSEFNLMSGKAPAAVSLPDTMIEVLHDDDHDSDPHCLEKRVYYKVISGAKKSLSHTISTTYRFDRLACFNFYTYMSRPFKSIYRRVGTLMT